MELTKIAGFISTAVAAYCIIPYVLAILNGKTKPHQLSWLVSAIMNGIAFLSQYLSGGRLSTLVSLIFFAGSFIILLLSLKYGVRNTSKWDKLLFGFALLTIAIWFTTHSNDIAIWLTLLIDIFGTSMVALKVKSEPHSEDPFPWTLAAVAYIFSLLSLAGQPLGILYVRPIYGLICNLTLAMCIYYFKHKNQISLTDVEPV
ncbi:MAG TPA: hypothetical protein VLG36_05630 [Candidatus Chromulinivoraceae bacterium]|nr:hypothetical protein [Candidatus Chromulinivoraceae bacterium]